MLLVHPIDFEKLYKCPLIEEWMKKMWYINAVKYYTVEEGEGGII